MTRQELERTLKAVSKLLAGYAKPNGDLNEELLAGIDYCSRILDPGVTTEGYKNFGPRPVQNFIEQILNVDCSFACGHEQTPFVKEEGYCTEAQLHDWYDDEDDAGTFESHEDWYTRRAESGWGE